MENMVNAPAAVALPSAAQEQPIGTLRLFLFGAPRIERDGISVPAARSKGMALLAYLAVTRQPQQRENLLGLLWPEFDTASARNNLRRELSLLKAALDDELQADRSQVALAPHPGSAGCPGISRVRRSRMAAWPRARPAV